MITKRTITKWVWAVVLSMGLTAPALARQVAAGAPAQAGAVDEDQLYKDGTQAIEQGRWNDAEQLFAKVAANGGSHAEGALYWKAYAEDKGGDSAKALESCAELSRRYPQGKWLEECQALGIEIRAKLGKSGIKGSVARNHDTELKLLALNSLMQEDETQALPQIKIILNGPDSERLKEQAFFVLLQSRSKAAEEMMNQIARNTANIRLQTKAIEMIAAMRGREATGLLNDLYRNSSSYEVKRAIIHSYVLCGDPEKLSELAEHESDARLTRSAVQGLGMAGATGELGKLYQSGNTETRAQILDAMILTGDKGGDFLAKVAASENDPKLRLKAVRLLGLAAGSKSRAPALVAAYHGSKDDETRKAVVDALFMMQNAHELIGLAREEKDPEMKKYIAEHLMMIHSPETHEYVMEVLEK